ncbi:DUF5957 family protein [Actinorugispora endophytica]|uniref:DUF5957 family protein n=1 Tax=Actinorugispora endophytica TaxID=1605990 RepID=UPI00105BFCE5|nr:DUF5957 family protein [Actinorugispora endophytica]
MAVLGLLGGFVGGLVLSEVVAVVAHLALGVPPEELTVLRFTPLLFALVFAVVAPLLHRRRRSASG